MAYVGRFAPSPTGDLHLGSLAALVLGYLAALRGDRGTLDDLGKLGEAGKLADAGGGRNGQYLLRVEDIDRPRVIPGAEATMRELMAWLGVIFTDTLAPVRQSERSAFYDAALRQLGEAGLTYYCDCSRAELASEASAPHVAMDGSASIRYTGRCREFGLRDRSWKRAPALRLRVPAGRTTRFSDRLWGSQSVDVAEQTGDFVLRRGDGLYAYQLAVVVDDLTTGITEVVRGADLLSSTGAQVLLAELLGAKAPTFFHIPMVVEANGQRLAKRDHSLSLAALRVEGCTPQSLVLGIAYAYGLADHGLLAQLASRKQADLWDALAERFDECLLVKDSVSADRIRLGISLVQTSC
jgi:glutamyl-tRNA synthetase